MLCFLLATLFPFQLIVAEEASNNVWSYWTNYNYVILDDGSARVTFTNHILTDSTTAEYLENYFDQNNQTQLEVAQQTIVAQELVVAEKLGRNMSSRDLTFQVTRIENSLVVEISWTWSNFAARKDDSWIIDALSVVPVTLEENGNLTVALPKSVEIVAVSPKEDERLVLQDSIVLVWDGPKQNVAPTIEYSTFWDRYQLWIEVGIVGAIGAILAIVATRKHRRRKPAKK